MNPSENTELLEVILQATTEGWWEWNVTTNETYHSPGWYRMLGIDESAFPSSVEMWLSLIHQDDRDRTRQQQDFFMSYDTPWEIEFRMRTHEEKYLWILSRGRVIQRDHKGRAIRLVGVHINIQEKKENQQLRDSIQEKDNLVRGIMQVTFSSLTIYDFMKQRMIFSQGLILKKLGYDEIEYDAISEKFFGRLLHPDDLGVLQTHLQNLQSLLRGKTLETIVRFLSKDGTYHWIAIRDTVSRRDENGEVKELIGSALDITRYKELKVQIDEKVKLLESLSYRNSHELRAPVATILGLTSLLRHEMQFEQSVQELLTSLEKTVSKMDDVIRDFGASLSGIEVNNRKSR